MIMTTHSKQPASGSIRPLAPAIHPSSVFNFTDLDDLESYFSGSHPGYLYARDGHPNADDLSNRLARLEHADWASITSSGMSAIAAVFLGLLGPGRRIVASRWLYGKTIVLIRDLESRGTQVSWFTPDCPEYLERELEQPADLVLVETVSNPLVRVADIGRLGQICQATGVPLAVDNTFATPIFARPLEMGASIVIESLTKLANGHSDATLGLVAGLSGWKARIHPMISLYGLNSSPFDCWLTCRGLETLELRVKATEANACQLALFLASEEGVKAVHHPSLPGHPDHALTVRTMPSGSCNIVAFELAGGRDAAQAFIRGCPEFTLSPSLGHTGTTLSYPAGTSHRGLSQSERDSEGIGPGLLRVSVGIETFAFIQAGFAKGMLAVNQAL